MEIYFFVLLAIIGGISIGFQAPINAALSKFTGIIESSFISFMVGAISLLVLALATRKGHIMNFTQAQAYLWTGGLLGAIVVTVNTFVIPKIGSLAMISSVITGQMVAALLIDQIGFLGLPRHPLDLMRIAGVGLMALGVWMVISK